MTVKDTTTASAKGRLPEAPDCPFCGETDTELMNAFGSQLSVSTYWCNRCRSPFEFMKWLSRDGAPGGASARDGAPNT